VPEALLSLLKLCLLALLYLFFFRVLWAVWNEVRGPKADPALATTGGNTNNRGNSKKAPVAATRLVMTAPAEHKGTTFVESSRSGAPPAATSASPTTRSSPNYMPACSSRMGNPWWKTWARPTAPT
jgi:hypothetical protein